MAKFTTLTLKNLLSQEDIKLTDKQDLLTDHNRGELLFEV